jgi:hypothetical protein
MNTDEPIVTAIDHYLSHIQFRDDQKNESVDWQERVWKTKDKLLKLQLECRDVDYDLVSWEELTTLDDLIITIGFYEIPHFPKEQNYMWKMRRDKDPMIPPTIGNKWYEYLGPSSTFVHSGKVVVLLSDEGVLFVNEIARRIRECTTEKLPLVNRFQDTSS